MVDSAIETFLPRRNTPSEYDDLRRLLLDSLQEMSGTSWTDYNLHDPGVTIAEQLAFVLTDINYRTDFSIKDLLVEADDKIRLGEHGVFQCSDAMSCQPLTRLDLQHYLLSRIDTIMYASIEDIHIKPSDKSLHARSYPIPGLFRLRVKPRYVFPDDRNISRDEICQKIRNAYCTVRNLNEDIYDIDFIEDKYCRLLGEIVIDNSRPAMSILAEIYDQAQRTLLGIVEPSTSSARSESRDVYAQTHTVKIDQGIDGAMPSSIEFTSAITLSGLSAALKRIPGVIKIKSIAVDLGEDGRDRVLPDVINATLRLEPLQNLSDVNLLLRIDGKRIAINMDDLQHSLKLLNTHNTQLADIDSVSHDNWLSHNKKPIDQYTSVMAHFPHIYGVSENRMTGSLSDEKSAQIRQLKGFLRLFDHVMADHLSNVEYSKLLFSLDRCDTSTYISHNLDDNDNLLVADVVGSSPAYLQSFSGYASSRLDTVSSYIYPHQKIDLDKIHGQIVATERDIQSNRNAIASYLDALNSGFSDHAKEIVSNRRSANDELLRKLLPILLKFSDQTERILVNEIRSDDSTHDSAVTRPVATLTNPVDDGQRTKFRYRLQVLSECIRDVINNKSYLSDSKHLAELKNNLAAIKSIQPHMCLVHKKAYSHFYKLISNALVYLDDGFVMMRVADADASFFLAYDHLARFKERYACAMINDLVSVVDDFTETFHQSSLNIYVNDDAALAFSHARQAFIVLYVPAYRSLYKMVARDLSADDSSSVIFDTVSANLNREIALIDDGIEHLKTLWDVSQKLIVYLNQTSAATYYQIAVMSQVMCAQINHVYKLLSYYRANLNGLESCSRTVDKGLREGYAKLDIKYSQLHTLKGQLKSITHASSGWLGREYDDYYDRKNRALDFMLAMNGRDNPTFAADYNNFYLADDDIPAMLMDQKIALIHMLHGLSSRRAGGVDDSSSLGDNRADLPAFMQYVYLILGLNQRATSVASRLSEYGLGLEGGQLCFNAVIEHQRHAVAASGIMRLSKEVISHLEEIVFKTLDADEKRGAWDIYRQFAHHYAVKPILAKSLLFSAAVDLANYRLAKRGGKAEIYIVYQTNRHDREALYVNVGRYDSWQGAITAANQLTYLVKKINSGIESCVVIEHSQLRTVDTMNKPVLTLADEARFYSSQVTVAFVGWTARFSDADFRGYVSDLVRQECPAHNLLHILWCRPSEYLTLERLNTRWQRVRKNYLHETRVDKKEGKNQKDNAISSDKNGVDQRQQCNQLAKKIRDFIEPRLRSMDSVHSVDALSSADVSSTVDVLTSD